MRQRMDVGRRWDSWLPRARQMVPWGNKDVRTVKMSGPPVVALDWRGHLSFEVATLASRVMTGGASRRLPPEAQPIRRLGAQTHALIEDATASVAEALRRNGFVADANEQALQITLTVQVRVKCWPEAIDTGVEQPSLGYQARPVEPVETAALDELAGLAEPIAPLPPGWRERED